MAIWIVPLIALAIWLGQPVTPVILAGSFAIIGISFAVSRGNGKSTILRMGFGLAVLTFGHFVIPAVAVGFPHAAGDPPPEWLMNIVAVSSSDGLLLSAAALAAFGAVLIGMVVHD